MHAPRMAYLKLFRTFISININKKFKKTKKHSLNNIQIIILKINAKTDSRDDYVRL
jgi:hypothetical protein